MALTNEQLVTELYIAYFDRAPDPTGLNIWVSALNSGVSLATIAADFAKSTEAQTLYPFLATSTAPVASSAMGFVNSVYENLLDRVPDSAGSTFWTGLLSSGSISPAQFILDVVQSVNAQSGTADTQTLANKVTVADFYSDSVSALNAQFSTAAATAAIAGVNGTAASVTAAEAQITATVSHMTFTLTAGADTISDPTGIGHDVVNAPLVIGPLGLQTMSLNVGDTIALTGPSNIANLTLGGTIGALWPAGTTISGVQTINFTNVGDVLPIPGLLPAIVNGNDITGMTTANMVNSAASVLIGGNLLGLGATGLPTLLTTVGMTNTGVQTFALEVQNSVLAAATSPALTVNLSGVGNGVAPAGSPASYASKLLVPNAPLTGTGVQDGALWVGSDVLGSTAGYSSMTFNVTGNDAVQLGTFLNTTLTSITIAGSGSLVLDGSVGTEGSKVTTITSTDSGPVIITGAAKAGAAAGGGEVTGNAASPLGIAPALSGINGFLNGNTVLSSVTTGAGNDWVDISSMSAAAITATGLKVDLGAGTNELVIDSAVANSTSAVSFFTDVQVLGVAAGASAGIAGTIDMSQFPSGVTELQLIGVGTDTGALTVKNVASGFTVDLGAADTAGHAVTITSAAPGDGATLTVDVGQDGGTGPFGHVGLLTLTGFGTDNIVALGHGTNVGTSHDTIDGIIATDATIAPITVAVSGDSALHIATSAGAAGSVGFSPSYGPIGPAFSLVETGNGTFFTDTDTGAVRFDGSVNVVSISAGTSGGLIMDSFDAANQGTTGVVEIGSATKANFLAGSFGNDVITMGSGGGTVITEGGADKITLGTHLGGDTIDLFVGTSSASSTPAYAAVAGSIVNAGVSEDSFWGNAPGASHSLLTLAANPAGVGVSTDASTITGFNVVADTIDLSAGAWKAGAAYFGLTDAAGGTITAGSQQAEAVGPGAILDLNANATANIIELGAGGGNAGLANPPLFANAAALANQLQTDSYHLTFNVPFPTVGSSADFIVAYQNTTGDTVIADLNLVATAANATDVGTQFNVHVSDMAVLKGVALAGLVVSQTAHTDIAFV